MEEIKKFESFEIIKNDMKALALKCDNLAIVNSPESALFAKDLAKEARGVLKWIEDERKKITTPMLNAKKEVDSFAKSLTEQLNDSTKGLRDKILDYETEKENIRIKEIQRIEAEKQVELDKLKDISNPVIKEELTREIEVRNEEIEQPKKSSSLRKKWAYEILDIKDIPLKYLTVDEQAIKQAIKDGVRDIKGIKIYQKSELNLR